MNYIIAHYKEFAILISGITGLLALVITLYSKYRDANIKDKEIELKKDQFNLEMKHQISKEKYQELYEIKIDTYIQLYSEVNKFRKHLYDIGKYFNKEDGYGNQDMEELTVEDVNISTLKSLFGLIDSNQFVISEELMDDYRDLYDLYRKHTAEFDFMLDVGAYVHPKEAEQEWIKIRDDFYKSYKESIDNFFNQIEREIQAMKQVLEH